MKKVVIAVVLSIIVVTTASCGDHPNKTAGDVQKEANTASGAVQPGGVNNGGPTVSPVDKNKIETVVWAGEWKRMDSGRFNSARMVIFNEDGRGFEFQIEAFSGSYNGSIAGKAEITGNRAWYRDTETGADLSFVSGNGTITVEADEKINQYHAGAGVTFDGGYKKGEMKQDTVLSLRMVENSEQEAEFMRLVGGDVALFLDTAQISIAEEDLDGYRARVNRFWVRGLARSNESIIMLMPDNRFCAAVIDPENNKVKVYTNAGYIDKVPVTIDKWRENFKDLRMEFIRKP